MTRRSWAFSIAAIIALGLLSRAVHTGWILSDKYLGDALYAMMVYAICRLALPPARSALCASLVMTALETFQLTGIPARLLQSPHVPVRLAARLMGIEFSFLDLLAYAIGIAAIHLRSRHTAVAAGSAPDQPGISTPTRG